MNCNVRREAERLFWPPVQEADLGVRKAWSRRRVLSVGARSLGYGKLLGAVGLEAWAAPAAGRELHVAIGGKDTNDGTVAHPLATVVAARDRLAGARGTVYLHAGVHQVEGSLELNAANTATGVSYRSYAGERATLTNARRIVPQMFRPVTDGETLKRIPAALHGKILELDLATLQLTHDKRYPELFNDNGGIVELFFNDQRMSVARYPNTGYMQMKRVLVNGGGMEQAGDWKQFYDAGAKDQQAPRQGVFEYRDSRTANWADAVERGVWLKGYWRVPWENQAVRVAKIDTENQRITLAAAVPGGIGNKYARPAGNGKENYWLINLLEELDRPGEWCLDFKDRKIYFYPPGPMEGAEIRLADSDAPVIHLKGTTQVELTGLGVSCGLGDGIVVEGGSHNRIAGCDIRNVTRYGVRLREGAQNELLSSEVSHTGAGGVWLGGGDEKVSPRLAAGHRVVNNHIHHFGEIELVYAPGINAGFTGGGGGGHHVAVGMYIAHNLLHDGPHAGVLHGSWDHVMEYNEIFRVCRVSNDMGYFYCYDLYARSGGRTLRYNFMHNSPLADGIYFDADHHDDKVYGNVVHVGGVGYLFKRGSDATNPLQVHCWNNLAIDCRTGYRFLMREGSEVHDNVAVNCKEPYVYITGNDGKGLPGEGDRWAGKNATYESDPGFVNAAASQYGLKPGNQIAKDLPGFKAIPLEKIGLYVDEYRKALPDYAALGRFTNPASDNESEYTIQDR